MVTLKCDVCAKDFLTHDDGDQFIVCDDCQGIVAESENGKGGDGDE